MYGYVTAPQCCTCAFNIASRWRVVINNHAIRFTPDFHSNFVHSISIIISITIFITISMALLMVTISMTILTTFSIITISLYTRDQNSIIALAVDFSRSLKLGSISGYNKPLVASALEMHAGRFQG